MNGGTNKEVQFSILKSKGRQGWGRGVRWRRKAKGAKPMKSAHLVTEDRADASEEKGIVHWRRKGTRRKMKILKLGPMLALDLHTRASLLGHGQFPHRALSNPRRL